MVNKKLTSLYEKNWEITSRKMNEVIDNQEYIIKPTNPLLLVLKDEEKFNNADIRIIIYGQETNDWCGNFEADIEETKLTYNNFFNTNECFKYAGHFWNGISLFIKKMREKYPEKKVEFLWNNVVKFGRSGGKNRPPTYIYEIEKENFAILNEEINIINPNLLLFLSGPEYDDILINQIKSFSQNEELNGFSNRQLTKFKYNEKILAYRTYHPNYLYRNDIDKYFDRILQDFKIIKTK